MSGADFVPGLRLNRDFYRAVVGPIVQGVGIRYHSAALIGYGSDVLGFDTPQSRDHNWGPRLQIFLDEDRFDAVAPELDAALRHGLPSTFGGYSVHFSQANPADNNTQYMVDPVDGEVNHLIEITTVRRFIQRYLGVEPEERLADVDWLALPEQRLLEVTGGHVFHDGLGTLGAARARFAYFPRRIWLIRLAAQWQRIAEEEPFVGRTGDVGDDLGSWILSARIVRDVMRLCFLYARRYAPYSKWLGTAFNRLPIAARLGPMLVDVQHATDWRRREAALAACNAVLAAEHNRMGLTPPLDARPRPFFDRPYQVLSADRFAEAIMAVLPGNHDDMQCAAVGAVDQFSDCVAIDSSAHLAAKLKDIYR